MFGNGNKYLSIYRGLNQIHAMPQYLFKTILYRTSTLLNDVMNYF